MYCLKFVSGEEIRRVSIERSISLANLTELAISLFPSLPKDFVFQYRDDEGDNITVSSDRELIEGFRLFHSGAIIRIAIVPRKTHSVAQVEEKVKGPEEKAVPSECPSPKRSCFKLRAHRALCDECTSRIRGIRWKCAQCPDYDLCDTCHTRKVHNHHEFTQIELPMLRKFGRNKVRLVEPEQPKQEEPKKEEPKKEEPKQEEPKVEEPKKEEPKQEEPKKEEPKVEEPKKEEPKVEEPKKEEPKKEEPKKEEPKKEEPKKEEPKKEEPKKEEPKKPEPAPHPFESKLQQLDEMGFSNRVSNIALLVRHNGDMLAVVRDLLE